MIARFLALCTVFWLAFITSPATSQAEIVTRTTPPGLPNTLKNIATDGGVTTDARITAVDLGKLPPTSGGNAPVVDAATAITYRYETTTVCSVEAPGSAGGDRMCAAAARGCIGADGPGPLLRVWRLATQNGQPQGGWEMLGVTCNGNALPNARPMLTMAMIQEAFHLTPWATARTEVEPVGNVTLVGLDTFYRVEWSAEGFQPGEVEPVDPARMLGYRVDIRPRLTGLMYHFGDDQEFGPTPSMGGRWPDGPIRHQYRHTGGYPVNVAVTWGADFRIDGGEWAEVPGSVTVAGPATQVQVKEARAVLVQR
ncbi:MAG: hypothetical protein ACOYBY_17400 [Dermatophilaceae bacterium]